MTHQQLCSSSAFPVATASLQCASSLSSAPSSENDLGVSRHHAGDLTGAMECYERALRNQLDSYSPTLPNAQEHSDIAHCELDIPEPRPEADAHCDSRLIGMGRFASPLRIGHCDATAAIILYNISLIKMSQSYFGVAKDLLELALMELDKLTAEDGMSMPSFPRLRLVLLTNLGAAHYRLGQYEDAADCFEDASCLPSLLLQEAQRSEHDDPLAFFKGGNTPSVKVILRCLIYSLVNCARARDASGGGRTFEALAMVREASGMCDTVKTCCGNGERVENVDAELASGVTYVEAIVRHRRGELKLAEESYRECIETSSCAPLRAAAALRGLGRVLFERRCLSSCIGPLRLSWSLRARFLGEDHVESIDALYILGRALHDAEQMVDALAVYERTHSLQRRVFGPSHANSLQTLCNVARVRRTCGQVNNALESCSEAIQTGTEALGERHPFVLEMLTMRGMVLLETGQREEASATFGDVVRLADKESVLKLQDLLADCLRKPCFAGGTPGAAAA